MPWHILPFCALVVILMAYLVFEVVMGIAEGIARALDDYRRWKRDGQS